MKSQDRILIYIYDRSKEKTYPPSVREVCEGVGLKSPATVHAHIHVLHERNLVDFEPKIARSLHLTDKGTERVEELKK